MSIRPTVGAAIIALNEERNLDQLLPQLRWLDEVVVVDGGSSDRTVEVARRHGCHVAERAFATFAEQRNYAILRATSDWLLSIDADERPTQRLAAEIHGTVARTRCAGFRIPIRSTILGRRFRRSGTQDDRPVRLFRRDRARWIGDVHEVVRVPGRVGQLRHWLDHETQPTLEVFLAKMHRYTLLEARARVAAGRGPRRRDRWIAPLREVFRRLIWKQGILDGPEGWAFCLLSGLSEWVLAEEHYRAWIAAGEPAQPCAGSRSPLRHKAVQEASAVAGISGLKKLCC